MGKRPRRNHSTKFKVREVKPEGVLVVARNGLISDVYLQHGDIVTIPEWTNTILISGEVTVPQAIIYTRGDSVNSYIDRVGGFTDRADRERLLIVRRNGEVIHGVDVEILAGDEILVLPKVPVKNLQIAKTIAQVMFQIALSAATVFGL